MAFMEIVTLLWQDKQLTNVRFFNMVCTPDSNERMNFNRSVSVIGLLKLNAGEDLVFE